jgi:hypothetical protein
VTTAPFFDLYRRGEVPATAIDDIIEAWHDSGNDEERPRQPALV